MRYALLTCTDESAVISDEERTRRHTALSSFEDEMRERGVLLASEHLHPADTATTVRCWDGGDVMIADGPFAGTREQIGGLFVVECKDLDAAIEVATRVPAAWYGTVEVRPLRLLSAAAWWTVVRCSGACAAWFGLWWRTYDVRAARLRRPAGGHADVYIPVH